MIKVKVSEIYGHILHISNVERVNLELTQLTKILYLLTGKITSLEKFNVVYDMKFEKSTLGPTVYEVREEFLREKAFDSKARHPLNRMKEIEFLNEFNEDIKKLFKVTIKNLILASTSTKAHLDFIKKDGKYLVTYYSLEELSRDFSRKSSLYKENERIHMERYFH